MLFNRDILHIVQKFLNESHVQNQNKNARLRDKYEKPKLCELAVNTLYFIDLEPNKIKTKQR